MLDTASLTTIAATSALSCVLSGPITRLGKEIESLSLNSVDRYSVLSSLSLSKARPLSLVIALHRSRLAELG